MYIYIFTNITQYFMLEKYFYWDAFVKYIFDHTKREFRMHKNSF